MLKEYWKKLGPGLVTGAADDDPSGIATYSQAGSRFGFDLLWTAVLTFPLMAIVQEMCARIGLVTGRGLAANIRQHYPRPVLYLCTFLLFIANIFNIGADLSAMGASVRLVIPRVDALLLVLVFAIVSLILQIFVSYRRYATYLKYLTFTLLSYIIVAFAVHTDWSAVLQHTIMPSFHFSREYLFLLCAVLGTTISPYLFFWQTSQEVEEERPTGFHPGMIRRMRIDVWSGMLFSNVVMFFIILASAATLYVHGITNIATAADAAAALRPFAGSWASVLFAVGIIGTGFLAIPVLAGSTSYAISESFGWRKEGLYRKFNQAHAFYAVIAIAVVIGLLLNFLHIDPLKALFYSAVANGLIAPVMLWLVVRISGSKKIMGAYVSHPAISALGWVITIVMTAAAVMAIISLL